MPYDVLDGVFRCAAVRACLCVEVPGLIKVDACPPGSILDMCEIVAVG